jgi:three-Cys-motif partner protein
LKTGRPILYVDGFAGKGKFDDGKDGSPRIALAIRDKVLGQSKASIKKIDSAFIDLYHKKDLVLNTADFTDTNGAKFFIEGTFEENIVKLLTETKKEQNVFIYIDPYGIKALDCSLFDKFADFGFSSIEMLINMNSFGFLRNACIAINADYKNYEAFKNLDDLVEYDPTVADATSNTEKMLTKIAGDVYWKEIAKDFKNGRIDGYKAEKRFSMEYKKRLNKKYKFVLDMPIKLKANQHPKYRMIHATNHPDGCILMAENMWKRKDRLCRQQTFFETDAENKPIDTKDIKNKVIEFCKRLPEYKNIRLNCFIASFYNYYELICSVSNLKNILKELDGTYIIITRKPATTEKRKLTKFMSDSSKNKVLIRRNSNEKG